MRFCVICFLEVTPPVCCGILLLSGLCSWHAVEQFHWVWLLTCAWKRWEVRCCSFEALNTLTENSEIVNCYKYIWCEILNIQQANTVAFVCGPWSADNGRNGGPRPSLDRYAYFLLARNDLIASMEFFLIKTPMYMECYFPRRPNVSEMYDNCIGQFWFGEILLKLSKLLGIEIAQQPVSLGFQ